LCDREGGCVVLVLGAPFFADRAAADLVACRTTCGCCAAALAIALVVLAWRRIARPMMERYSLSRAAMLVESRGQS